MKIDAIMLLSGWEYEGFSVLGLFTPDDELGAFAFMLEQMNTCPVKPDYMQLVLRKGDTRTILQKWTRKTNDMNQDSYWMKEI
jgi:hypothetical protein